MKTIYCLAISIPKSMAGVSSGEQRCSPKLPGIVQADERAPRGQSRGDGDVASTPGDAASRPGMSAGTGRARHSQMQNTKGLAHPQLALQSLPSTSPVLSPAPQQKGLKQAVEYSFFRKSAVA